MSPSNPKDQFKSGVIAFRKQQFSDAIIHFDQALNQNSNHETSFEIKLLDSRAAAKEKLKDFKGALLDAKRVIDLCPELPKGYIRAARLFHQIGKLSASIQMYDRALAKSSKTDDPGSSSALKDERENVRKLEKVQANLGQLKSPINYLGRLPFELFLQVINYLDDPTRFICMRVCSSWRSVIYQTAKFWTSLTLQFKTKKPTTKLKYWLSRLEGSSYKLESITILYSDTWPLSELLSVFKTLISKEIQHLKNFTFVEDRIMYEFPEFTRMLNHLIEYLMTTSTSLCTLEIKTSIVIYCPITFSSFLIQFPDLIQLRVIAGKRGNTVPMQCEALHRSPPPSRVRKLDSEDADNLEKQDDSPQNLPQLQNLALQGIVFADHPADPVQLESLRVLALPGRSSLPDHARAYTSLIDLTRLPQLEQLVFGSSNPRENVVGYADSDWTGCLALPNLKHMTINRTVQPLSHFFAHEFAIKPEKLEHLGLVECVRISFTAITNLLTASQQSTSMQKLSYLDLTGCTLITSRPEKIEWLRTQVERVLWQPAILGKKEKHGIWSDLMY
ncbi:uncharacterized protein MELLADRAFT_94208 [Melampsora larici-populina 98AG31]|uniref:F-box domain-containing protein n=1 Tax=Melampsora larici-populina (strain 98AG31 / pathotype 3-4-7) TaxID=747676 RepID=F4S6V5_MELLP|nr:uncharacterized protein MELLADRAFT_94208 [Melampsora larici-populina 98AG31]EGF99641.1 hypothetical protein MELLADRAFT_94208 [Melampsora larici-populina 98AG31]